MSFSPEHRLVVVTNPNSSRAKDIQKDVIDRLEDTGIGVTQLPVPDFPTRVENIHALSESIQAGDRLLVAGGDGTANTVINAYMEADAQNSEAVDIGFLGFGNANDMASTFNRRGTIKDAVELAESSHTIDVNPLDLGVNGVHVVYGMGYASVGDWTASIGSLTFNNPHHRVAMQNGKVSALHGAAALVRSKGRHGAIRTLPPFHRPDDPKVHDKTVDIIALNIPHMSLIIRDRARHFETNDFRRIELAHKPLAMVGLLSSGIVNLIPTAEPLVELPGMTVPSETLIFDDETTLPAQVDGEFYELDNVQTLTISKNQSPDAKVIHVISTASS